jgi:diguanylate cyclase (GGDEF)-like protein
MYLPVFAHGLPHDTKEQRRANLVGWVYAAFRVRDFMASMYGSPVPGLSLAIYDGVTFSDTTLMYAWPEETKTVARNGTDGPAADEYMVLAGRTWTVALRGEPEFESRFRRGVASGIAAAGAALSISLAVLVWLMVTARARALRYAALMTEELRLMAQQDPLTSLPNRALFGDRLKNQLAWARRHDGRFALIFLDLDNFKIINDTHGHGVGDVILIEVAQRLKAAVRTSDTVGRLGGDEFVVLMPELTVPADAMGLAEKIRLALREPILFEGREMCISCSLGIAVYPDDGTDETTLVRNADHAMYRAKERGRDAAVLASQS